MRICFDCGCDMVEFMVEQFDTVCDGHVCLNEFCDRIIYSEVEHVVTREGISDSGRSGESGKNWVQEEMLPGV